MNEQPLLADLFEAPGPGDVGNGAPLPGRTVHINTNLGTKVDGGTTDAQGWVLHTVVQKDWYFHNKPESKMPGGESFLEIKGRFVPFIEQLISHWGNTDDNLLLVAHGGLYMAMLPVVLRNISFDFSVRNAFTYTAVTVAESRPDGLHCLSWCGQALE